MKNPTARCLTFFQILAVFTLTACGDAAQDAPETASDTPGEMSASDEMTAPETATSMEKINLNTGTEEEFLTIPNVGDRVVHEFEEYRPYVSIQQFRQEIGKYVDEDQVAAYEEYVFVPVSPNESDEATLMQIPGVDAAVASDLVSARPFDSNDAFITALVEHVSAEQAERARPFLTGP